MTKVFYIYIVKELEGKSNSQMTIKLIINDTYPAKPES
jgi:hypothetical protein